MSISERLIQNAEPYWQAYVAHPFVQQLARGTLPKRCFQHYLKQDYLYLFQYSRALGLSIFKAENFTQMEHSLKSLATILSESKLHVRYCAEWGISEQELFQTPESAACVAYTRYMLDCGVKGTLADLFAAIAPCAIGYAEIGKRIKASGESPADNPYQSWIDLYASPEFQQAIADLKALIDHLCQGYSEAQIAQLQQIFNTATRMEAAFWQMGLDLSE